MPSQPAYRALSDPTRRAILWLLRAGDRSASDIAAVLDAPPAVVRRHLDLLTAAGLVRQARGTCTLRTSVLDDIVLELAQLAGRPLDPTGADLLDAIDLTHAAPPGTTADLGRRDPGGRVAQPQVP